MPASRNRRFAAVLLALALSGPAPAQESGTADSPDDWALSPHARAEAEAFSHWNAEGLIPPACAVCHSGAGFRDFHGLDGTPAGIDGPHPVGSLVDCDTCHAPGAPEIAEVTFPSGATVAVPPGVGSCYTCHQGRVSGPGLRKRLADLPDDAPDASLDFANPHYKAAAASVLGSVAGGMFEYPGGTYAGAFAHPEDGSACTSCHAPHALSVRTEICASCHGTTEPGAIRSSALDHDGDGDLGEGMKQEIAGLAELLLEEIRAHARDRLGAPIAYAPERHPYFFRDGDGDGIASAEEARGPNRYVGWSPRLLRAAYNYQFVAKDPGAYAHNPAYTLQVLIDSIADLAPARAEGLARP